jgi:ribosomal protein S18 acetylase RimI-like enzyme
MAAATVRIRRFRNADLPFYVASLEALQDHLTELDPFGIVHRGPQYGRTYARFELRQVRRNHGCLLLAELAGRPVGFVAAHVRPRQAIRELELRPRVQGFILDLFVVPGERGRGVGTALLRAAERHLARAGCTHVWLDVFAPNRRAQALYESLGYRGFARMMMRKLERHGSRRPTRLRRQRRRDGTLGRPVRNG